MKKRKLGTLRSLRDEIGCMNAAQRRTCPTGIEALG